MKFGHLIDYNMRIIFIEKWYAKSCGETTPRPLSEKLKLNIYLDQSVSKTSLPALLSA